MWKRLAVLLAISVSVLLSGPMTRMKVEIKSKEGKPVDRAAVIIKFVEGRSITKLGRKNHMQWELRTNQMGTVTLPAIPQGTIRIQVIAKGYQTFGDTFELNQEEQTVPITLNPPQTQYSAH